MLYHTAIPASTDGEVSPKADALSPKAGMVLANSPISQKFPAQLKSNTALQMSALPAPAICWLGESRDRRFLSGVNFALRQTLLYNKAIITVSPNSKFHGNLWKVTNEGLSRSAFWW
jgi:hypothetical protein